MDKRELERKIKKLRGIKRIRAKGAYKSVGAEYERVAADNTNQRAINCHCGKRVPKGEGVKVTYLHEGGFITREKCFCSWECSPVILKSK